MERVRKKYGLFKVFAGVVAAGVISLAVFQHLILRESIASFHRVTHTGDVLFESEQVISALKDVETGQRGFVLTGSDTYLEPFNTGRTLAQRSLTNLLSLTVDNPAQQRRVLELQHVVESKIEFARHTVELRRSAGFESALRAIKTGEGQRQMDAARAVLRQVQGEERRLLTERRERSSRMIQRSRQFSWLIAASLAAFSVWVFLLFRRLRAMSELVTICAWSGQVKVDGQWVSLETFLKNKVGVSTTHGISEKAAAQLKAELGMEGGK